MLYRGLSATILRDVGGFGMYFYGVRAPPSHVPSHSSYKNFLVLLFFFCSTKRRSVSVRRYTPHQAKCKRRLHSLIARGPHCSSRAELPACLGGSRRSLLMCSRRACRPVCRSCTMHGRSSSSRRRVRGALRGRCTPNLGHACFGAASRPRSCVQCQLTWLCLARSRASSGRFRKLVGQEGVRRHSCVGRKLK